MSSMVSFDSMSFLQYVIKLSFIPEKEITARFNTMKSTYFSNKKKVQANPAYSPKWEYFKLLIFLDEKTVTSDNADYTLTIDDNITEQEIESIIDSQKEKDWTNEDEETLIYFHQAYPELYDHKEPEYKKAKKSGLLDSLSIELNNKYTRKYLSDFIIQKFHLPYSSRSPFLLCFLKSSSHNSCQIKFKFPIK